MYLVSYLVGLQKELSWGVSTEKDDISVDDGLFLSIKKDSPACSL